MSLDKHEQILNYIYTGLLPQTPGIDPANIFRDASQLTEAQKPGIVMLDGDEKLVTDRKGHSLVAMPPAVYKMTPQIFVLLPMVDNIDAAVYPQTTNSVPTPTGPAISVMRAAILKIIVPDQQLIAMCGPNGQVDYDGIETDMKSGSTIGTLGAQLQINLIISYTFDVRQL
jgi:hypothetical protein